MPGFAMRSFVDGFGDARLLLNEVNANISSSHDLIVLLTVGAGSVSGIEIVANPDPGNLNFALLTTLPDASVATGDLIVVHLAPTGGIDEINETTSKMQCIDVTCYANAWDVFGGAAEITYTNRVLAVRTAGGTVMDAVAFARSDIASPPSSYPQAVQYVQSIGKWLPPDCAGSPCTYASLPTVVQISADWTGLASTSTGASASRLAGADTRQSSDWQVVAQTFGAANP